MRALTIRILDEDAAIQAMQLIKFILTSPSLGKQLNRNIKKASYSC